MSDQPTPRTDALHQAHSGYHQNLAYTEMLEHAQTLETELGIASLHPSDEVNARYIVPLHVALARAMAARDKLIDAGYAMAHIIAPGPIPTEQPTERDYILAAWNEAAESKTTAA